MAIIGTRGRAPVELIGQVAGVPGGPVVPAGPFVKPPGGVTLVALSPGEEWVVAEAAVAIEIQYATDPAGPWTVLSGDGVTATLDGSGVKRSAGVPIATLARADVYLRAVAPDGTTLVASRSAYDASQYTHARVIVDTTHVGALSLLEVQFLDMVAPPSPDVDPPDEPPAPCEGDEGCSWADPAHADLSEDYSTYADAADFEATVNGGTDPRYAWTYGEGWSLTDGSPGTTFNCHPVVRSTRGQRYGWWTWLEAPRLNNIAVRVAVKFDAGWTQPPYVPDGPNELFLLAHISGASSPGFCSVGLGLAGDGLYLWTYVSESQGGTGYAFTKVADASALVTGSWREFRLKAWVEAGGGPSDGTLRAAVQWGAPCALINSAYAPGVYVLPDTVFDAVDCFNHTYDEYSTLPQADVYHVGPWRIIPGNIINPL